MLHWDALALVWKAISCETVNTKMYWICPEFFLVSNSTDLAKIILLLLLLWTYPPLSHYVITGLHYSQINVKGQKMKYSRVVHHTPRTAVTYLLNMCKEMNRAGTFSPHFPPVTHCWALSRKRCWLCSDCLCVCVFSYVLFCLVHYITTQAAVERKWRVRFNGAILQLDALQ